MSRSPFQFLENASEPVKQIAYLTICSDLPAVNKSKILYYALEHNEPREIYNQEVSDLKNKIWTEPPPQSFKGLDIDTQQRFCLAISNHDVAKCSDLLPFFPNSSREFLDPWFNTVKDEESLSLCVFEGMKQRLTAFYPEQGHTTSGTLSSHKPTTETFKHSGPQVMEATYQDGEEAMEIDERGEIESISADAKQTEFKPSHSSIRASSPVYRTDIHMQNIPESGARSSLQNVTEETSTLYTTEHRVSPVQDLAVANQLPRHNPIQQVIYERAESNGTDHAEKEYEIYDHNATSSAKHSFSESRDVQNLETASAQSLEDSPGIQLSLDHTSGAANNWHSNTSHYSPSEPPSEYHSLNSVADNQSLREDRGEETQIAQDFDTDNIPQEDVYNVLLLGETGVGKTTFINSCANYVKYETMDKALNGKPEILMNTTFTAAEGVKTVQITVQATTGETGARNSTNEHTEEAGKSRTQEPLIHKMMWTTEDGRRKLLRIIDTPGVNDTRGQDQDTVNFKKVLRLIQQIGNLHAICILLKPNESVMSLGFRRSLDYFLTKLHSNALQNMLFCFTNTRSTLYRPGDTYTLLEQYFKDLKEANGIEITLSLLNVFCFENDCFRYMCLLLSGRTRVHKNHKQIAASWSHNVPEVKKFLSRIQHLKPHLTEETTNMDTVSDLLSELANPLIKTMQNSVRNTVEIAQLIEDISRATMSAEKLEKILSKKRTVIKSLPLSQPRTICTSIRCSSIHKLADGSSRYEPKKGPCHDPCFDHDRNRNGKICIKIFNGVYCKVCRCHLYYHQNVQYLLYEDTEDVFDHTVQQELLVCNNETRQKQVMLDSLSEKLAHIDEEVSNIRKICVEFSAFLNYSSVKNGADPFSTYLDNLIQTEMSVRNTIYFKLYDILSQHKIDVQRTIRAVKYGQQPKLNQLQVQSKIDSLCRLQYSGPLITEIVGQIAKHSGHSGNMPIGVRM